MITTVGSLLNIAIKTQLHKTRKARLAGQASIKIKLSQFLIMTNITLSPTKTKSINMENLKAIAAGEKPATNRIPKGNHEVMSVSWYVHGLDIRYVNMAEVGPDGFNANTPFKWVKIKLDDIIAFVRKHGIEMMTTDENIQSRVQVVKLPTDKAIKSAIYSDIWGTVKRMLDAGEVSNG